MKKEEMKQTKEGELEEVGATSVYDHKKIFTVDMTPDRIWQDIPRDDDGNWIVPKQVKLDIPK
jgi:hypothetical protein